jgi:hypothetical protein
MLNRCVIAFVVCFCVCIQLMSAQEQENPMVVLRDGRLTVRAQKVPLDQLMSAIQRASGSTTTVFRDADPPVISADVTDMPLESALRILLRDYDAFLLYSAGSGTQSVLRSIWVYHRGEAEGFQPAPPEALQAAREIRSALGDTDPAIRMKAFRALLERPGPDARDAIAAAVLAERNASVRGAMVEAVRSSGSELPDDVWTSLVTDPAEQVRILALDALQGSPNLRAVIALALADSSPHVRQRAEEMARELEATDK